VIRGLILAALAFIAAPAAAQVVSSPVGCPAGYYAGSSPSAVECQSLVNTVSTHTSQIAALQTAIPPTITRYETAGSYTFTPKASTIIIRWRLHGVGGPGAGSGTTPVAPTIGLASTFGPATAPPGAAANGATAGGVSATPTLTATTGWSAYQIRSGRPGETGLNGYSNSYGGFGGGALGGLGAGALGSGGGGAIATGTASPGAGGGEGAEIAGMLTVIPSSIAISLAAIPAGGAAGTGGSAGGAGGNAWLEIEEDAR